MRLLTRRACVAIVLLGCVLSLPIAAQNSLQRGDLVLHYSAVASTSLTPDIARQYAITRSSSRALLNISLQRVAADGRHQAVAARVSASATNLNGQRQDLAIREVREGDAIYYLAEPRTGAGETLEFELSVLPEGASDPMTARFRQEFFAAE